MKLRTKFVFVLLALLLAACNVDSLFFVIIDHDDETTTWTETPTFADTATNTPNPTPTTTPTWTATWTEIPTETATLDPTPTRETVYRVQISVNVNVRAAPRLDAARVRLAASGEQLSVTARSGDWLNVPGGWIFYNPGYVTFISGSFEQVPISQISQTANRISLNINGLAVPDWDRLWNFLEEAQPSSIFIMDHIARACEAAERFPDAIVIHREYSSLEESEWQKPLDDWFAGWQGLQCRVVRYLTNEPGLGNIETFIQSEIAVMDAAAARGIRLCVGNFGVGTLPDWAVQAGLFDDWLHAVVRGNHLICAHEYTTGILAFGSGVYSREQLLDIDAMQPQNWVTQLPIAYLPPFIGQQVYDAVRSPFGYYEQALVDAPVVAQAGPDCGAQLPPYWHILRTTWLILRAECIGLNPDAIQIVLSEGLWDNLNDIDTPEIKPVQTWRTRYGIDKYFRDMRGVPSYVNLWAAYYPFWSTAEAAVCQLVWWDFIAPSNYIGVDLFTWSTNPHWISFDVSGVQGDFLYEFHELIVFWSNGGDMREICGDYDWIAA